MSLTKRPWKLLAIMVGSILLTACATAPEQSEIAGQLQDGGWVMNIPGRPHTHAVVLEACPDIPIVTTHVHDDLQAEQAGKGPHKHKGCFVCPPKNPLVKRIL